MQRKIIILIVSLILLFLSCGKKKEDLKTENNITIGGIMPLSGSYANYGVAILRGIELAINQTNENGGINGRKLKLIIEDDKAEPKEGINAITKLIQINKVPVIIGAVASSVTLAIAPVAEQNKVVLISPASSSPQITNAGDYIFRNYPSDVLEGKLVAEFALRNNFNTASVLTINNEYGQGLNQVFVDNYLKIGGSVLDNESFAEGTIDFRTILLKTRKNNSKCIFLVGYGKEMGTLIKQARELGIKTQFLSTVNFYDEEAIKMGGNAVEGVIFSSPIFDSQSSDSIIVTFIDQFRKKYQVEPDVWAAHGYDACQLIAYAMKNSGLSSDQIKNGLYKIKNFNGVAGRTTFDSNGDVIKDARFLTVKNAKFVPYTLNK